jgi:hypothetical protein
MQSRREANNQCRKRPCGGKQFLLIVIERCLRGRAADDSMPTDIRFRHGNQVRSAVSRQQRKVKMGCDSAATG